MRTNVDKPLFGLTKADITQLLATLHEVEQRAINGTLKHPNTGICYNWGREISGVSAANDVPFTLIPWMAKNWKHNIAPGSFVSYPVPDDMRIGMWQGHNLELRLDLIRYVRKRLRDWHRRTKN